MIISVVNNIKEGLRSEPLLITDFVWLKEISLLTSFVDKSVIIYIVLGVIATLGVYILLRKRILPGKIFNIKRLRFSFLGALIGLVVFNFIVFRNETDSRIIENVPIISKLNNGIDINWMGFSTNASYKSLMYVWTKQLTKSVMETPDGYSEERIEEIAKKYRQEASVINVSRANNIADQTVIFILSESFADPSRVPGVTLSENPIPNITQIKAEYTSGLMISDFYGGGTANMEMQALLGIPYSNLSSSVSSFTTEVIPKMLYLPSISNNFNDEDKYIVHLDNAKNYSRNTVYERMHFDTFIAESGSDYKPKKVVINDGNASDTSSYNVILDYLNTSKNQFFQLITIQNHLPWGKDEPANLNGYGMGFTDVENTILSRYTRDLRDTDYMTANFLEELSKVNKKITVVFYGDHLPGLYPDKIFANNNSKYETDYFIWSNFETEKLNYPLVTSSNFPALLLDVTNSKVSPYYALLTKVLDESVLVDKALTKEQEEIKKELAIIQYDITLGKGYIMKKDKSFFELDGD